MEAVLNLYEQYLVGRGNKPRTVDTTIMRLRTWHEPEMMVSDVTTSQLSRRYEERQKQVSVDTHRNELAQVKTFWRWCVKKGYCSKSPVESIEPRGRRKRGKKQLRRNEARALFVEASRQAEEGDESALAVLAVLLLGIRSSEILQRRVRDVDAGADGVLLWIDEGKTEAATRYHDVPEPLASLLAERVSGREAEEYIFSAGTCTGHRQKEWLRYNVKRLCRASGVPEVTTHGLRGTWATLTSEAGISAHIVSRELGHSNQAVTRQHYVAPGADARARTRQMLHLVKGGRE